MTAVYPSFDDYIQRKTHHVMKIKIDPPQPLGCGDIIYIMVVQQTNLKQLCESITSILIKRLKEVELFLCQSELRQLFDIFYYTIF